MKEFKLFCDLLSIFIVAPIWYFLMYTVLAAIHPDRLVWFLFWLYVPFGLFVTTVRVVTEKKS